MPRGALPALTGLDVGDDAPVWRALGFTVDGDGVQVGDVRLDLCGPGGPPGLSAWGFATDEPLPPLLDGIATRGAPPAARVPSPAPHPNGAERIDHVVVRTPDLDRTTGALRAAGFDPRRVREAGPDLRQAFLWAGEVLIEVVGPARPLESGPASLWGLTFVTPSFDWLLARPDRPVGKVRDAVQDGRRIVTVHRGAGSGVRLAFLSPHPAEPAPQRPSP